MHSGKQKKIHVNRPTTQTGVLTCTEPHGVFDQPALDLGVERGHALVVKGHLATYEHVQDHSKAPYVDLRPGIYLGIEKFRRSKIKGATKRRQVGDGIVEIREAKIDNLNIASLRNEDVLDFEVCRGDQRSKARVKS